MDKRNLDQGELARIRRWCGKRSLANLSPEQLLDRLIDRAIEAGLPWVSWGKMRFDQWDGGRLGKGLAEALDSAMKMAKGEADFTILTLAGPPGVGKTHLAIAIAWERLIDGADIYYRQAGELLDELRHCFALTLQQARELREETFDEKMWNFKFCDLLIIDDLGIEKRTDWAAEKLDMLIDYRWMYDSALVVTTNAKSEDLPPRIADRLADVHSSRVIQISASSYRRGSNARDDGLEYASC